MAIRWSWMAVGWRGKGALVTKGYNVTSSAYCIKPLYCMNRQFIGFYHDGGRSPSFFYCLCGICQECRANARSCAGMVLGYLSHILADMLTPAGVPLLWPCRWRFRLPILVPQKGNQLERFLCMALFAWAIWMPQTVQENSAVRWSSQMINTLQMQFNRFITHQVD